MNTEEDGKYSIGKPSSQVAPFLGLVLLAIFLTGSQIDQVDHEQCVPVKSRAPPQYIPIAMTDHVTKTFPSHYRLLAYTEGTSKNVEKLKSIKFSGVPVLYIPDFTGASSYKVGQKLDHNILCQGYCSK